MSCEGIDKALAIAVLLHKLNPCDLALGKADIKAAYRRIPILPLHRKFSWIAFRDKETTYVARHNALCFGSTGSVFAWNRLGMFIQFLILKVLRITTARWVDDYFWIEPDDTSAHAASCVERMVKFILGDDAIEKSKLQHGKALEILGLQITLSFDVFHVKLPEKKAKTWMVQQFILTSLCLFCGKLYI